jgi:hypothetical protein
MGMAILKLDFQKTNPLFQFQKIGGHIDYTKHKLINIILTLIFSIVIFMTSVLLHFNGVLGFKGTLYQQILNTTLSFIMLSSIQLAMQHFLIFILAVRRRCAELNRILRETFITDLQIKSIISKNNESDLMELLDNIQQLYGELVDISNYVSRCYSIPVIFGIAAYFCNDVMCLFGTIAIASRCQSFISIIVCCLLLVFDFGYIFAIVYAGELVKNQVSESCIYPILYSNTILIWTSSICKVIFFPAKFFFCILEKRILAGENLLCKEAYSF